MMTKTPEDDNVRLVPATRDDAPLLENLLQLYIHDLSEAFSVDLDEKGRFAYPPLPRYWSEPDSRFAFLIHAGARVVGFVFVTVGSPASEDPDVYDIAEFFVLRRYRLGGIGRRAAFLTWDRFPGRWFVRVAEGNAGALRFWGSVIREYTRGEVEELQRAKWRVYSFDAR